MLVRVRVLLAARSDVPEQETNMKVTEPTPPPAGSAAASPPEADAEITARLSRDSLARVMEEMRTRDPAVLGERPACPTLYGAIKWIPGNGPRPHSHEFLMRARKSGARRRQSAGSQSEV